MLNELLILIFLIVVVEAITEIIVSSTIFQPIRNFILKRNESKIYSFLGKLIQCGYCASVWISLMVAWIVPIHLVNFYIDFIIFTFVLHRLSNVWHEFLSRWFSRHPIIMSINLFKSGDADESESESKD